MLRGGTAVCRSVLGQTSLDIELAAASPAPAAAAAAAAVREAVRLCLVLDNSGSMAGSPLDTAKRAVIRFAQAAPAAAGVMEACWLVEFNTSTRAHSLLGLGGAQIEEAVSCRA